MSLKKRDPSGDGDDSERESKREKRRRQRAAARRQKALAASERKRREETKSKAEKPKATEEPKEAEKPKATEKPKAGQPAAKGSDKAKKPKTAKAPAPTGSRAKRLRGGAGKVGTSASKVGTGVFSVVLEVLKLGREMLVIPLQVWLAIAEVVGGVVLKVWLRVVLPALRLVWRALGALLHFAERHVTPARALTVVVAVAIAVLVAAQWRDYSAVSVGTDAYSGDVGAVAPPPEVSSTPTHDAHGWVMLIIAALAAVALLASLAKRRRLGTWLVLLGIAVLVVSLAIDAPKGLDEGDAAVAYESASATLLSGFWLQIASGAVLIACGLLLPRALRPTRAPAADAEMGPSLLDQLVARSRALRERRRARPKRTRRLPRRLRRRPAAKGKVQGAGT